MTSLPTRCAATPKLRLVSPTNCSHDSERTEGSLPAGDLAPSTPAFLEPHLAATTFYVALSILLTPATLATAGSLLILRYWTSLGYGGKARTGPPDGSTFK